MNSLSGFVELSLKEGDDGGFVVFVVVENLSKGTTVTIKDLTLLSLDETELHVAVDSFSSIR